MHRRALLSHLVATGATIAMPLPALCHQQRQAQWIERMEPAMGSFTRIAIATADKTSGHAVLSRCFDYMNQVAAEISNYEPLSATSRLNNAQILASSAASKHFWELWRESLAMRRATFACFDPLAGPLLSLWRAAQATSSIPDAATIRRALHARDTLHVETKLTGIVLQHGGLEVGGIGKGFVADAGAAFLQRAGISAGRIACGGDLRFFGPGPWEVDVVHPRRGDTLRTLRLVGDCAISTSGDYENCWQVNGEMFHHLIDPATGYPARHTQQVTVVAPCGTRADALASALFLMSPAQRQALTRQGLFSFALLVDARGKSFEIGRPAK